MKSLDKEQVRRLLKGASLLTTGGGLCYADQCRSLDKYDALAVGLRDLNEFDDDAILVTAGEVGPASAPEIVKGPILPLMLDTWQRLTGTKISGVFPPELGQEMIVIDTAHALDVPLVDFDPAGGRAVPMVDISSLTLAGIDFSFPPLVLATDRGEVLAVNSAATPERTEDLLRTMSDLSKDGIVYFIGGALRAGDLKKKNIDNRSLSLAYDLGGSGSIDELTGRLAPKMTIRGKVTDKSKLERDGFNCYTATFTAGSESYTLYILNEVLFMRDSAGNLISAAPDKILLIDPDTLTGLSTADLLAGKEATLMVVEADQLWQSEQGRAIFGPERFSFLLAA